MCLKTFACATFLLDWPFSLVLLGFSVFWIVCHILYSAESSVCGVIIPHPPGGGDSERIPNVYWINIILQVGVIFSVPTGGVGPFSVFFCSPRVYPPASAPRLSRPEGRHSNPGPAPWGMIRTTAKFHAQCVHTKFSVKIKTKFREKEVFWLLFQILSATHCKSGRIFLIFDDIGTPFFLLVSLIMPPRTRPPK